ncbi:MAG TPA: hydroxymethylpyrimidine/phosphomethylpyrimidine kinase [Candidatus Coprenecus merdigallinarum]|nr:hydroxymethylpyrimidine/phosphomethylpyrimidine kinase [Candidatus Coprenecus merdigallinarum]
MENKKDFAKVFMIAGSEPLGCCGIQADIKAVSACGGFAAGATTLLVDMNTTQVKGIRTMPVDIILSQSRDFLDDVGADCIKTGMLYEKQIVEAVAGLLREYPEVPKVIDPVMVDSGGTALILQEAIDAYRELLFPQAEIITPNIHEARVLAGEDITLDNVDLLIRKISEAGCSVIIKSIPDGDNLIDVLYNRRTGSIRRFSKRRIDTRNVNGTGDTFGSAIATYIARKYDLEAAVERAEIFINESIAYGSGYRFGPGYGPVHPFYRTIDFFEREDRSYSLK